MMGQHRVPPVSLAEKRRLNALASRGGGDRVAIAKVARKQNGASLARAYALRYADAIADHELAALSQLSFEEHEELVTVGARVGVPATHPNKYGYATSAVIVSVSERQCADGKHRTLIPTPILAPSACSARSLRLPSQRPSLVSNIIRTQMSALIIFRQRNKQDVEVFVDELSAMVDNNTLIAMYDIATGQV